MPPWMQASIVIAVCVVAVVGMIAATLHHASLIDDELGGGDFEDDTDMDVEDRRRG